MPVATIETKTVSALPQRRPDESADTADIAMARYCAGDDTAFGLVYDGLAPQLYGYLLRRTHDTARAEDLLQQTFLHIHRARDRFMAGCQVAPWAFAIARRLFIDAVRRDRRERLNRGASCVDQRDRTGAEACSDEWLDAQRLAGRLQSQLDRLPDSQREAFELVTLEGLSLADTARVLGITVGAVKLRVHRAYVALRAVVETPMPPDGGGP